MTIVTGNVKDVGLRGSNGRLIVQSVEFYGDGNQVTVPSPVEFPITGGVVSADLLPGPARLTIHVGSSRKDWFVHIPATAVGLGTLIQNFAHYEPPVVSEAIRARDAARAAAEAAAASQGAAAGSATAAATSATSAAGSASTATSRATAAAGSATAAATSATNAAGSAGTASTKASEASTARDRAVVAEGHVEVDHTHIHLDTEHADSVAALVGAHARQVAADRAAIEGLSLAHTPRDATAALVGGVRLAGNLAGSASAPEVRASFVRGGATVSESLNSVIGAFDSGKADLVGGKVKPDQLIDSGVGTASTGLRVDKSVGTRVFVGDVMIHGDTGWRDVTALAIPGRVLGGAVRIRRTNNLIIIGFLDCSIGAVDGAVSTVFPAGTFSDGFRASGGESGTVSVGATGSVRVHLPSNGQLNVWIQTGVANGTAIVATDRTWPTSLPGIPA